MCKCKCDCMKPDKRPMTTDVMETRDGIKIMVDDVESDSLVILKVERRRGLLTASVGLRGNYDVRARPIRWFSSSIDAPDVSEAEREKRKQRRLFNARECIF